MNQSVIYFHFEKGVHLVCTNKVEMEGCETSNEPDSYEAVHYKNIWYNIAFDSFQKFVVIPNDVDQWKCKDIYAQDSWCWYEQEEEPIVPLQKIQYIRT